MSDTACSICSQSDHGETWRCETCGTTFTCPSAFLKMPTPAAEITAHRTKPCLGVMANEEGAVWPVYGEETTCGPVLPEAEARVSKTQRGFALAQAQQRRSQMRLVEPEVGA